LQSFSFSFEINATKMWTIPIQKSLSTPGGA